MNYITNFKSRRFMTQYQIEMLNLELQKFDMYVEYCTWSNEFRGYPIIICMLDNEPRYVFKTWADLNSYVNDTFFQQEVRDAKIKELIS